jgi:hypothetical protein
MRAPVAAAGCAGGTCWRSRSSSAVWRSSMRRRKIPFRYRARTRRKSGRRRCSPPAIREPIHENQPPPRLGGDTRGRTRIESGPRVPDLHPGDALSQGKLYADHVLRRAGSVTQAVRDELTHQQPEVVDLLPRNLLSKGGHRVTSGPDRVRVSGELHVERWGHPRCHSPHPVPLSVRFRGAGLGLRTRRLFPTRTRAIQSPSSKGSLRGDVGLTGWRRSSGLLT